MLPVDAGPPAPDPATLCVTDVARRLLRPELQDRAQPHRVLRGDTLRLHASVVATKAAVAVAGAAGGGSQGPRPPVPARRLLHAALGTGGPE